MPHVFGMLHALKQLVFYPSVRPGAEAGPARGAIMGHPSEEELFLLLEVKWHCQHGQSQAFESEEVGYPKYEILQYINKCINLHMLAFITRRVFLTGEDY